MSYTEDATGFPDELVSPEEKETKEYGLKVAKAIFYHHEKYGSELFVGRARKINEVRDYLLGRQDPDQYKPLAGVDPQTSDAEAFVQGIRWDVIAYATKRINIAVSKIAGMKYKATCDAVDESASELKAEIRDKMKILMESQEFLQEIASIEEYLPEDLSLEDLPSDKDQLQDYLTHTKLFAASLIETAVEEHLKDNDYDQLKRECAQDLIEAGIGAVRTGLDENIIPFIDRLEVDKIILPQSNYPDFRDAKYWGYLDFISLSDLEKESQGQLTKEQLEIAKDTREEQNIYLGKLGGYYRSEFEETVRSIPVLRFEWKTTEVETYAKKINEFGNPKLYRKKNTYKGNGKNDKIQHKYTSVYEGCWVLGTDLIYSYRRKHFMERKRGNMNETPLSIKVYAPLMRNNTLVSAGEQIIPILDDLQSYNIKVRHILASPFPNGAEINLHALKAVGFEWGNKKMEPQDLLSFMFQKKILVTDRQPLQGSNDQAVVELNQGIQLQEYLALIANKLGELDEVLGLNAAAVASQLGERAGATTTQLQIQQSDLALDYLFYADRKIFIEVCKSLAILHCYSEKYGKPGRYNRIYGKIGSQMFRENLDLLKHDYSFDLETKPTDMERADFLKTVDLMMSNQVITGSEATMLRRVDSMKKAEFELRRLERRRDKMNRKREMENIEANAQAQQQSTMVASQAKQAELEQAKQLELIKAEEERKTEQLKHKNKLEEIRLQESIKAQAKLEQIEKTSKSITTNNNN